MNIRTQYLLPIVPAFATALLTLGAAQGEAAPIQWTAVGGNDHFYEYFADPKTWADAQIAAQALGGYLATATSADENAFISSLPGFALDTNAWLGGFQDGTSPAYSEPSGGWVWATGESMAYTNWVNIACCHEPNDAQGSGNPLDTAGGWEDHLAMTNSSDRIGGWFDLVGIAPLGYVVESPVPEPASLIFLATGLAGIGVRLWRERKTET